ncbi:MAG TPA: FAD-binding oxidoreductase [Bellilinea sp.]|nr:FAD-binding oxidoreductase [Bellilinea sp.]
MKVTGLESIFGSAGYSVCAESLAVYCRDASTIQGECIAVVWPSETDQIVRLVDWACEHDVDLVPRGAGTGLCGSAVPLHSIVVDFSRLTAIMTVDQVSQRARVQAGVVLDHLNRHLFPTKLYLPVIPGSHQVATVGGMIATNAAGLRSVRYGSMRRWVEEVTLVDGQGNKKTLNANSLDDVIGREGTTGFVTEAVVCLTPTHPRCSLSLRMFTDHHALLQQQQQWVAAGRLNALEYINRHAAQSIGWEPALYLIAEFEDGSGDITEAHQISEVWRKRDGLYPMLARNGYPMIEDPQIGEGSLGEILDWLDSLQVPVFGHLGVGILHPCFSLDDDRVGLLYQRVAEVGGKVSGEHGIGLKKKNWIDASLQSEIRQLKTVHDPHNVINRGKLS